MRENETKNLRKKNKIKVENFSFRKDIKQNIKLFLNDYQIM